MKWFFKWCIPLKNSVCQTSCLQMKPTFITEAVINSSKDLLIEEENRDPMLLIEIEANRASIAVVTFESDRLNAIRIGDKWQYNMSSMNKQTGEKVIGIFLKKWFNYFLSYSISFNYRDNFRYHRG